jgi:hypothetical protein
MVYEMMRDVEAMLHDRNFPVECQYEPSTIVPGLSPDRTIITFARDGVDSFASLQGRDGKILVRAVSVTARVFAASSVVSADRQDHERECEAIVDALLVAIHDWCAAPNADGKSAGPPKIGAMRYLKAADLGLPADAPTGGVAYQIEFAVNRGVRRVNYAGQNAQTIDFAGATNEVDVRTADPENPRIVP